MGIAIPALFAGLAICSIGFFYNATKDANGVFPVEGPVGIAALWEGPWMNDTIGVAMMTMGWILLLRKIKSAGGFYKKILLPVSKASYGMYLCHMLVLSVVATEVSTLLKRGEDGILGIWTTPIEIFSSAIITFLIVSCL